MSVSSDIRTILKNRIGALASIQKVYDYRELNPTGYPAVWILPANLDGTFASTTENKRAIGFEVYVLYELGQDVVKDGSISRERQAENAIGTALDDIINDLDGSSYAASFADLSESRTEFINAEAADAQWGEIDAPHGKLKAVQITLIIRVDYAARTS